jgi:hypothetical protein
VKDDSAIALGFCFWQLWKEKKEIEEVVHTPRGSQNLIRIECILGGLFLSLLLARMMIIP